MTVEEAYERRIIATHEVYFIRQGKDYVKIGICERGRVLQRLCELQIGNPQELSLMGTLMTDDPQLEFEIHDQIEALRVRGEWFRLTPELRDTIYQAIDRSLGGDAIGCE